MNKPKPVMNRKLNVIICSQSLDALEEMSSRLGCTKSQIIRYLIFHYGKKLK